MGVCIGPSREEFAKLGLHPKNRGEQLEEFVTLIKKLWTEDVVFHYGRYYKVEDVSLDPKPIQKPFPPIYITGWPYSEGKSVNEELVESILTRVAKHADGWMVNGGTTPKLLAEGVEKLKRKVKSFGKDPAKTEVVYQPTININKNADKAKAQSNEFIQRYYGGIERPISVFGIGGTTDEVIDFIQEYTSAGVTTFVFRFASPHQHEQLKTFTSDVLPSFA
jgi:alkanesulfonate monooxygenase SsuD/methylene tetrahydromethanopterin reductase-like flavin-dependent oxidoreductase (luciferase family)